MQRAGEASGLQLVMTNSPQIPSKKPQKAAPGHRGTGKRPRRRARQEGRRGRLEARPRQDVKKAEGHRRRKQKSKCLPSERGAELPAMARREHRRHRATDCRMSAVSAGGPI